MSLLNNNISLGKYAKYTSVLKGEDTNNTNKIYLENMIQKIKGSNIPNKTPVEKIIK